MEKLNTRALLVALCAALGVVIVWLARTNRRVEAQLASTTNELRLAQRRTDAPLRTTAVTTAVATNRSASDSEPAKAPAESPGARLAADPAWRAARFNEAMLQVEARYGRMFQKLGWPADRIEAVKRQLAANDLSLLLVALAQPAGSADAAEAMSRRNEMEQRAAQNQAELRQLLGTEDFAKLDQLQRAEPYRDSIDQITNAMRSRGVAITDDVEDSVLNAYASALQAAAQQASGSGVAPASEAERAAQRQRLQAEIMRSLSGVLNPQQLDAFMQSYLEQQGG